MASTRKSTKKAPGPRAKGTTSTKFKSGSRSGKSTKKATQSRKRAASDGKLEDESDSEDAEPTVKTTSRKKARLARRNSSDEESEVEEIDDVDHEVPAPEVISDDKDLLVNENDVSKIKKSVRAKTHKSTREMALTSISAAQSLKKNL